MIPLHVLASLVVSDELKDLIFHLILTCGTLIGL
jgi:hypothetical protein